MLYDRHKLLYIVQLALERTCWKTLHCVVSWVCTGHTLSYKVTLGSSTFILPLSQNNNENQTVSAVDSQEIMYSKIVICLKYDSVLSVTFRNLRVVLNLLVKYNSPSLGGGEELSMIRI